VVLARARCPRHGKRGGTTKAQRHQEEKRFWRDLRRRQKAEGRREPLNVEELKGGRLGSLGQAGPKKG